MVMREDAHVRPLDRWLARELAADRCDHTVSMLVQQAAIGLPDPAVHTTGADALTCGYAVRASTLMFDGGWTGAGPGWTQGVDRGLTVDQASERGGGELT